MAVEIDWYGADPCFWFPLEKDARAHLPETFRFSYEPDVLRYFVESLSVPGDQDKHDITIEFWRDPPYSTFGLLPQDYPRVFTSVERPRKHAFSDLSLCIWHPLDPEEKRWISHKGLLILVEMVRVHLLLEINWFFNDEWVLEDVPH